MSSGWKRAVKLDLCEIPVRMQTATEGAGEGEG